MTTRVLVVAAALLISCPKAHAQSGATGGDIVGRAGDASGAVLPGATVRALNTETELSRTTVTDAEGRFALLALPPGPYVVQAEFPGLATQVVDTVTLTLGSTVDLGFVLKVAGITEQVTVVADIDQRRTDIDPRRTEVSTTIQRVQIDNLPTGDRNFIGFATVTPGVTIDRTPQQGASASSGLTFVGQRGRSNNITVDGLDNNDATVGGVRAVFSQDAVREFQVLTHSYSAEFGKASGGVVNIVTRSGTNAFAGTAFLFGRDESLNAKQHFEKFSPSGEAIERQKAPYGQTQFGGVFGGPIRRNRLFHFASFERLKIATSNFVTIDDRTMIFHPATGSALGTPADILSSAGLPVERGHVPYRVASTQFLGKVDYHGESQALTIRFNTATGRNEGAEPFGGLVARSRAASLDNTDYMLAGSHTLNASPRLVNEARFQVAYRDQSVFATDPRCDGICDREDEGGPTLEVVGVASVGRHRFTPQPRENIRYQFLNTVSYARGRQLFKGGIDVSSIDVRRGNLPLHFGGRYIFAPLPAVPGVLPSAVSAIQALALGVPAAYVQGYGDSASKYAYSDIALFAQDDWQPATNLTIKLGLRYQRQFWPAMQYVLPGYPQSFGVPGDRNDLAPRLAAAWQPRQVPGLIVRGAYGLFFENQISAIVGVSDIVNGRDGVRTLVQRVPASIAAWRAPGRRLPESSVGSFPSLVISLSPGLQTPYARHQSVGFEYPVTPDSAVFVTGMFARGFNQIGTIDYNPIVPALGAGRRPLDVRATAGTSASVLQYTPFGETWYRGVVFGVSRQFAGAHQFLVSYTLSEATDNSTDFQSAFLPQANGVGRDPARPEGLPIGFNPDDERGPSLHDQRHRIVGSGVWAPSSGFVLATIIRIVSGRPYNVLAGTDLNGDGDGGAFPSDRARTNPVTLASSLPRNAGRMPWQAAVDVRISKRIALRGRLRAEFMAEAFNLLNRVNFEEVNNIFGPGPYPSQPLQTFGQFEQAGPPRQLQLGVRVSF